MNHFKQEAVAYPTSGGSARAKNAASNAGGDPDPLWLYKSPEGHRAIMAWYESVTERIECPYQSLYANTRFGRTHILAAGQPSAPPLFLIPGIAGCAPLWRRQLSDFGKHFRVYALDIPGQPGLSDPHPPSFLNRDFVDWLLDVLDDLGIERANFAGVSVGAWIAMRMGIDAPERTRRVVMLGPTGIARAKLPVKIWVTKVMQKRKNADVLQDDLTAKAVQPKSPGGTFGTFDRQLARAMALCTRHYRVDLSLGIYSRETRRVNVWQGLQVLRKFFLPEPREVLSRFAVPGMVVFGQHEVLYRPRDVGRKAQALMGDIRVEIVPDAGHAAIYDRPEIVNRLFVEFLKG